MFTRSGFPRSLAFEKRQQVGIDRVRLRSGHAVREVLVRFEGSVLQRLKRGVEDGDLPADTDCAALARYFITVMRGLGVSVVSGIKRKELLGIARIALQVWPEGVSGEHIHLPKLLINRAAENNSMMHVIDERRSDLAADRGSAR